jgi:hypothetical protein
MLYLILVNDKRNWKKLIDGEDDEQVLKFSSLIYANHPSTWSRNLSSTQHIHMLC